LPILGPTPPASGTPLLAAVGEAAATLDADGRVVGWNAPAEEQFGITAADATGRTLGELGAPGVGWGPTRITLAADAGATTLAVWPTATGVSDVTDDDAIALAKGRALGFVAGPVWHELANSLGAIKAFATMLRLDASLPADLAADSVLLVEAVDKTQRLVRTYLETGRTRRPSPQPVRAAVITADVNDLTAYLLTDVATRIEVPDTLPDIEVDPSGFRLALLAVVIDAIVALGGTRARGRLVISAGQATGGRDVELVVEDSATPVPEADRAALFDPTRAIGSGRGGRDLAVARALLRRDGGDLRHETAPDGANRLILSVPSVGASAVPGPAMPAAVTRRPPAVVAAAVLSVIVCDDEDAIRLLISRALERRGMRVIQAASGNEAVASLSDGTVQVVIADQRMAGMTGTDLYHVVVERRPDLRSRFILMTGDAGEAEVLALSQSEGFLILHKPFELAKLSAAIAQVLAD